MIVGKLISTSPFNYDNNFGFPIHQDAFGFQRCIFSTFFSSKYRKKKTLVNKIVFFSSENEYPSYCPLGWVQIEAMQQKKKIWCNKVRNFWTKKSIEYHGFWTGVNDASSIRFAFSVHRIFINPTALHQCELNFRVIFFYSRSRLLAFNILKKKDSLKNLQVCKSIWLVGEFSHCHKIHQGNKYQNFFKHSNISCMQFECIPIQFSHIPLWFVIKIFIGKNCVLVIK